MENSDPKNKNRNMPAALSVLVALAVGMALGLFWSIYQKDLAEITSKIAELNKSSRELTASLEELKEKVDENQDAILKIVIDDFLKKKGTVDFTSSQIQDIGSGFYVVELEMKKHLTGIIFSGRIINTQSVRHRNVTFTIKVAKKEKDFTINMISPGNSTSFYIYVPDIKPEDAQYGEIHYKRSIVEYYIN